MDLAINEMKVQNTIPTLSQQGFFWLGSERAKQRAQVNLHNYTNELYCNVFCYPAEWFICFTKLYTNIRAASNQVEWARFGMRVELPSSHRKFTGIFND